MRAGIVLPRAPLLLLLAILLLLLVENMLHRLGHAGAAGEAKAREEAREVRVGAGGREHVMVGQALGRRLALPTRRR